MVLLNLTREQMDQKQYEEALANLNQLISGYSNTGSSTEAWSLLPSTYVTWGTGLREAGDFERSEQVFNDLKAWSQNNQKIDSANEAQRELAQTYLAWALEFQLQKQYENALAKLDLAVSVDPQAQFDSAGQVKAGQSGVYVDWGNDLLEQKQFAVAIEKFELAISKTGESNTDAKDSLANGQIQWARDLSTNEDFQAALQHLQTAQETAASEGIKKSVETALQETYLAFSNSSGAQARQMMREVLKAVCQKRKAPDLPIFGLNKDTIRFGIYGVEDKLPESLVAKTPGEMHYIACVETANETVETRYIRKIVLQTSRGYYFIRAQQFRVQILWNVNLIQTDTGKSVAETSLKGEIPPPFPGVEDDSGNYFYGPAPMEELSQWLQDVTR
jgi:tetratricopeptide (TPR) repeat protein